MLELQLSASVLLGAGVAVCGAILAEVMLAFKLLSRKHANSLSMVVYCLCPMYCILGFGLPFGAVETEELYPTVAVYALSFGSFTSVCARMHIYTHIMYIYIYIYTMKLVLIYCRKRRFKGPWR